MWERWKQRRRLRQAARRIAEARRNGQGVYAREWDEHGLDAGALGEALLDWCREVIGACRRPFGIDQFDLALAYTDAAGEPASRLYRLRPIDLYQGSLLEELMALAALTEPPRRLAAALFSWGDAAHEALPNDALS
jgi:hypothetical protein